MKSHYIINPKSYYSYTNGTSLQGYIKTTYAQLVETLGEPIRPEGGDGKVICEWVVLNKKTNKAATIYIYKLNEVPENEYPWHIGGLNNTAITTVKKLFPSQECKSAY
jgi:hypothetical protein